MIRLVSKHDTETLLALAQASGLFAVDELAELRAMLDGYHADHEPSNSADGEFWLTEEDGGLVSVAYCAPERMTQGTWNLYLIADQQRTGRGARLLDHVEQRVRKQGGRVLLVETMGIDDFEYVRAFYRRAGYHEEARIRDFYDQGQDKIVYWKSLASELGGIHRRWPSGRRR